VLIQNISNEIDLNWAAIPNADYYEVYRATTASMTDATLIAQPAITNYQDWDGVDSASVYYYQIAAIVGDSSVPVGTTSAAPLANDAARPLPSQDTMPAMGRQAEGVNDSEILLTWNAPEVRYSRTALGTIEMSDDGGQSWKEVQPQFDWDAYDDSITHSDGTFPIRLKCFSGA